MTGRLARGRVRLSRWACRGLMLVVPLPLLALAAAAFALAPSSISQRAGARPDERLLSPPPRASVPALAIDGRFAVTAAAVSAGERALSRRPGQRWPLEP